MAETNQPLLLEVVSIGAPAAGIRDLVLRSVDGRPLPGYAPGAHLRFTLPGVDELRHYSLITLTAQPQAFSAPTHYRLGIRLEDPSRGGSQFMHALKAGDRLTAAGPVNEFALHLPPLGEAGAPVVLIAGGIGITPIASMVAALVAGGHPFQLHYSGRTRPGLAYLDELTQLAGDGLVVHADDEPATRLDVAALMEGLRAAHASGLPHIYVCGPKGLIDAVLLAARERGWADSQLHFELFTAAQPQAGDQPFELECRRSGLVLQVPADKTILDVVEAAGCDPIYDCKRGECGVCQVTVLEGEPDQRDYVLSDREKAEGKLIQICISRSKTPRLVLDL